jgi:hypothetical protein
MIVYIHGYKLNMFHHLIFLIGVKKNPLQICVIVQDDKNYLNSFHYL